MSRDFYSRVEAITRKDNRYCSDAYEFIMQVLHYTQRNLKRQGHVTGRELLAGFKDFAREQFGPMAMTVLAHWGIYRTEDVGEIVFNLVDNKLLARTMQDTRKDFKAIYDFKETFDKEYKKIVSRQIAGDNL